jgi:hypothetical protein
MDVTATEILPADLRRPDSRDVTYAVGSDGGWPQAPTFVFQISVGQLARSAPDAPDVRCRR